MLKESGMVIMVRKAGMATSGSFQIPRDTFPLNCQIFSQPIHSSSYAFMDHRVVLGHRDVAARRLHKGPEFLHRIFSLVRKREVESRPALRDLVCGRILL